jgi:hypothetical protein
MLRIPLETRVNKFRSEQLASIAPLMRELKHSPTATLSYDAFADALVWSDELPAWGYQAGTGPHNVLHIGLQDLPRPPAPFPAVAGILDLSCIRAVLHYRSSLVLGVPDAYSEESWTEARRLFPEWPGFAPQRRSRDLEPVLREFQRTAEEEFNELVASYEEDAGEQRHRGT